MALHVKSGNLVVLKRTASGLRDSYPAANWYNGSITVKLSEDARSTGLDVYDAEYQDREVSFYGFNIDEDATKALHSEWEEEPNEAECPACGDLLDTDCQGSLRCPTCDPPCPGCYSGPGPS